MSSFFKKLNLEGPDPLDPLDPKPSLEESASLADASSQSKSEEQEPLLNGGIEDYLKISPATEDQKQEKPKKRLRKTNKTETTETITEDELVIQTTIAGVRPENLDITAQGDIVIIRGKRDNPNKEEKNYFYKECYWGAFSREIILPAEADTARAEAIMQDVVLTIRMPKIERDKKSKIEVR